MARPCANGASASASKERPDWRTVRRGRLSSPAIARDLGGPVSTVGKVLRRIGLGRLKALDPAVPVIRYERERPGELIHIDTKKLGRIDGIGHRITGDRRGQSNRRACGKGLGWEALHVAVDDASRLAYTEILPDERKERATAFLERALAFFACHGIAVERVMTDNGLGLQESRLSRRAGGQGHPSQAHQTLQRPAPTARPSASSRPRGANGSMRPPSRLRPAEPPQCPRGCAATTHQRPHAALSGRPPISKFTDNLRDNDI